MKPRTALMILVGMLLALAVPGSAPAQTYHYPCPPQATSCRFSHQTYGNFDVDGPIYAFWKNNGAMTVFGYPLTAKRWEQIENRQYQTQWFERNRLEIHPEKQGTPYYVELGRLGADLLVLKGIDWPTLPKTTLPPPRTCYLFPETGQNTCDRLPANSEIRFWTYWRSKGFEIDGVPGASFDESKALWGVPLSNERLEKLGDGNFYTVQWFERARFGWHPNNTDLFKVQGGLLGVEIRDIGGVPTGLAIVRLPEREVQELARVAAVNNIDALALDRDNTVIYGFDRVGVVALLTPAANLPDIAPPDLPAQLGRRTLGALTVVQQFDRRLPPGNYLMVFSPGTRQVSLLGTSANVDIDVVIRERPKDHAPLPRPVGLITSSEICIAWARPQVCLSLPMPLPGHDLEELQKGAASLGLDPSMFALDQGVPVVAGSRALETCAGAFVAEQPEYNNCQISVLAAPLIDEGKLPPPDGIGGTSIGLVVVLQNTPDQAIQERIFLDPQLKTPAKEDKLPAGAYVVYEVPLDGDLTLADGVRETRVRLYGGPERDFYTPAVSSGTFTGVVTPGQPDPDPNLAASSVNLILRGRCFFKEPQCLWARP